MLARIYSRLDVWNIHVFFLLSSPGTGKASSFAILILLARRRKINVFSIVIAIMVVV